MWPILTPGPAASGKAYLPCSCPGSCQQLGTWVHPLGAVLGEPEIACTKDTHNRSSGPGIPMKGPEPTWHRNQAGPAGKEKGAFQGLQQLDFGWLFSSGCLKPVTDLLVPCDQLKSKSLNAQVLITEAIYGKKVLCNVVRKCKEVPVWFPSFTEGGGFSFVDDTRAKRRLPEIARQQHSVVKAYRLSHNRDRYKLLAKPPQQALSIGTAATQWVTSPRSGRVTLSGK